MRITWKLAWAACLVSTMAFGDGPPPPEQGLFIGPQVGANLLTFAWPEGSPFGTSFAPGVRTSLYFPYFAIGGDLGVSGSVGPFAGDQLGSVNLGGQVMPYLMKSGSTRAYGLGGLNLGLELAAPYGQPSGLYPKMGFTLGLGLQQSISKSFTIGAEAGAKTQFLFGGIYGPEPTTTVTLTFNGQFDLWSPATLEKVPEGTGGPGPVSSPPADKPNSLVPPNPPLIYGRSTTPCTVYASDGWFEPTQGVWQDDPSFDDKPGKQLTRVQGDAIAYEAELKMATNRDTLLFGVHHYRKGGELVPVNDRNDIVLMGYSNCTVKVPVKFKFTRQDAVDPSAELWTSYVVGDIPLEGPAAPDFKPWTAMLGALPGVPEKPFRFDRPVPFTLKAELVRMNGDPTGLQMTVSGSAEPTAGPKVHFAPVVLTLATTAEGVALYKDAERMAQDTARFVPDLFPLAPNGLPTFVKPVLFFDGLDIPDKWIKSSRFGAVVAALNDNLAASTFLDGAGRVVAVMRESDYRAIFGEGKGIAATVPTSFTPEPQEGEAVDRSRVGRSLSWKVMMVPSVTTQWDTVGHELLHTLPEGWSGNEMQALCGKNYHNEDFRIANGVKIDNGGAPASPRVMDSRIPLMGPNYGPSLIWISQCTYWHLLHQLNGQPPDPPVLMLRAWLGRERAAMKGELKPVYNLMGHSDLAAGSGGPFAFVLKDAKGVELGRYPFTPRWNDIETAEPREIVSVVYRVPDLPGWREVELVGPSGVLDRRTRTAKAPELVITAPADSSQVTTRDGKIHVAWKATGEPGAPLLYTVSYSSDGGSNWVGQSFEQKETAFELQVDPKGAAHRVKVVVTDGTRSVEAVTRFTPEAP